MLESFRRKEFILEKKRRARVKSIVNVLDPSMGPSCVSLEFALEVWSSDLALGSSNSGAWKVSIFPL